MTHHPSSFLPHQAPQNALQTLKFKEKKLDLLADRGREGVPKADVLALVTRVIMRLVARM